MELQANNKGGLYNFFVKNNIKNETFSGLTVAIALVPEAIAFSFIAGVEPLVGLYAAFFMGLITSVLGGRPGMISGATGAIAMVIQPLMAKNDAGVLIYGDNALYYLFLAIILGGGIQILVGVLKLGKFIRMVPHSVMLGFVNGLAIVIFKAQFSQFQNQATKDWLPANELYIMGGLIALTMSIMIFLPKLTKVVPAALTAIVVVSLVAIGFGLESKTVGDFAGKGAIAGGLPEPAYGLLTPSLWSWHTLVVVFPFALKVAGVGLIESLLTLTLIDEITETRGSGNKEAIAQGLGNIVSGFFGSMGGCAMIGQSMININSGARKRLSGIIASVVLISIVLFLSPIVEQIPIAALVGVMFMVSIGTFEWASLRILNKIPKLDLVVIFVVTIVTVFEDLAVAVLIGVILAALAFAWEQAVRIRARKSVDEQGVKVYEIFGPLFFGSTAGFIEKFDVKNDPDKIVVDFKDSRISDQSGLEALKKLHELYESNNKEVLFKNLSTECKSLLSNAKVEVDPDKFGNFKLLYDA